MSSTARRARALKKAPVTLSFCLFIAILLTSVAFADRPLRPWELKESVPTNQDIPTPQSVLGYTIGQEGYITPWNKVLEYMNKLDAASDRISVVQYGTSTEGRPMIYVVATSENNRKNLDGYRQISLRLLDPRGLTDSEARELADTGKPVYWLCGSIHSTEEASVEMLMELAYQLAAYDDQWTKWLLDNLIIIMDPSINPDGHDMVADRWYKYKGTPYEGSAPPYYAKYISHDNNRDFIAISQKETIDNTAARLKWAPQIYHDLHESKTLLYMSPGPDPNYPEVSPITQAEWIKYAGYLMTDMFAQGFDGVYTYDYADMWYPGYNHGFTTFHNGMGWFFETQTAKGANPLTLTKDNVRETARLEQHWFGPVPITLPRVWTFRNSVDYQEMGVKLALELTAREAKQTLWEFYLKNKRGIEKGRNSAPYAYLIPAAQEDQVAVVDLVNNLRRQGIEVGQATDGFTVDGKSYPAGTYVVRLDQPYGPAAKSFLEVQTYPYYKKPYDSAAWTFGLLQDVQTTAVNDKAVFSVPTTLVDQAAYQGKGPERSGAWGYAMAHNSNNQLFAVVNELFGQAGIQVQQAYSTAVADGKEWPAGTVFVSGGEGLFDRLSALAASHGLEVTPLDGAPPGSVATLHAPRIGLFWPYSGTIPEGWIRFALDKYSFSYERIDVVALQQGSLDRFDVVIIPQTSLKTLVEGSTSTTTPPEYTVGAGQVGVNNLKAFVQGGGTLVTFGAASELPIKYDFGVDVKIADNKDVNGPGTILKASVDPLDPVGFGFDPSEAVWYSNWPLFDVGPAAKAVASYASEPLLSGYLDKKEKVAGKAAVLSAPAGSGKVVMFGIDATYRAQATGTYPFLFNAILAAAAE